MPGKIYGITDVMKKGNISISTYMYKYGPKRLVPYCAYSFNCAQSELFRISLPEPTAPKRYDPL